MRVELQHLVAGNSAGVLKLYRGVERARVGQGRRVQRELAQPELRVAKPEAEWV